MSERTFDNTVQIIKPAPDSQYRLVPCDCGSAEVVYAKCNSKAGHTMWRVVCTDCGKFVDIQTDVRHDAQMAWNRRYNSG